MGREGDDKDLSSGSIKGLKMKVNGLYEEVILAGFGGQGIILAGRLLAQTAMKNGNEVTYMPAYGAEMRGGTANSMVIVSDNPIASPLVSKPNSLIAMNKASLNKFAPQVRTGGLVILNSSLIDTQPEVDETIDVLAVPADEIAVELDNQKCANMVAMGAYLQKRNLFGPDAAAACLADVLAARYHKTLPVNREALRRGAEFAETHS